MTLYQPGLRAIQEVGYGLTGQRITCIPEVSGLVVDPSSLTVDIMRPGQAMDDPQIALAALVINENKWRIKATSVGEQALEAFFR